MTATRSQRDVIKLTAAVFLLEVFVLFLRAWLQHALTERGMSASVALDLSYLVVPLLTVVALYPLLADEIRGWPKWLAAQRLDVHVVIVSVAVAFCMRATYWGVLVAGISFGVLGDAGYQGGAIPVFWFDCPAPAVLLLALFTKSVLTPLVEETVNRGWILNWFREYGRVRALLLSAVLFALLHGYESLWYALLFGIVAGRLYMLSGTLWAPLIAHATLNGLMIVDWLCLRGDWNPGATTNGLRIAGMLAAVVAIAAAGLALLLASARVAGAGRRLQHACQDSGPSSDRPGG